MLLKFYKFSRTRIFAYIYQISIYTPHLQSNIFTLNFHLFSFHYLHRYPFSPARNIFLYSYRVEKCASAIFEKYYAWRRAETPNTSNSWIYVGDLIGFTSTFPSLQETALCKFKSNFVLKVQWVPAIATRRNDNHPDPRTKIKNI